MTFFRPVCMCLGSTNCEKRLSPFFSETNRYFEEKTTWHLYNYYRLSIGKRGVNLIFSASPKICDFVRLLHGSALKFSTPEP